ncbi:uncharacterized protein F4807DRAFT_462613 [Annulohypoxylon truncatum]|uniref:uncharacterized protein n=1 Tax=Annulohypoxylon truncatum TaxID=327061 RepID=UPI002007D8BB|nr:uncharacterized protein F4807DRAFT_462613 [Annulohypoxylon truncatum]KAI1207460.1 hypothetical protein F4807DRAFT_462613 [Annulohypoxylon truncatum]
MDFEEVPPMSPNLSGPAGPIPTRTSSKRALEAWPTEKLSTKKSDLSLQIEKRKMNLKPRSSFDSEYWSSHLEVLEMEKELHEYNSILTYREHEKGSNSKLPYNEWLRSLDIGFELGRKRRAIDLKLSAAKSQTARLATQHPILESWIKLFFGAASYGPRDNQAQSRMRAEMMEKYHAEKPEEDSVWEPVCGAWLRSDWVHAAHLYPSKSIEHIDIIFGKGAKDEIMTAMNGLFLCPDIEKILELGYIAIVPDVRLEADSNEDPITDLETRRKYVQEWESTNPKEYKVIILDRNGLEKRIRGVLKYPQVYNIKSVEDLDGRRLKFITDFRPGARYMWWAFLNSVVNSSYRNKATRGIGVDKEVELGNRYWGTRGRYIKRDQLLGFVEHLGQDIESISSSSIMEHGIDEEEGEEKPNTAAVVVIADTIIRQASSNLSRLGIENSDEESDDDEEEWGGNEESE